MRTTLNLEDDVMQQVSEYAASRSMSIGRAVSELVRKGLEARRPTRVVNGVRVFDLPPDSPRITSKHVKDLEAEVQ